jgi:hypothetical protein
MDMAKPRLAQTPLAAPLEEAERRILSGSTEGGAMPEPTSPSDPTSGRPDERTDVHTSVQTRGINTDLLSKLRKERQAIAVVGFKLPAPLKEELLAVAQYNRTDMTRLVIAALERLLPELPHPPEWKGPHKGL